MMRDAWWRNLDEYRWDAIRVTLAALVLTIIVRYIESSTTSNDVLVCRMLVQNAERYHSMSAQDSNPRIRLRHSAMAVANLQAARQLFNDGVIENATGMDVHTTSQRMENSMNENEKFDKPLPVASKGASKRLPVWP